MPLSVNVSTGLVKGRFGSGVVAGPNGEEVLIPARGRIDFEGMTPFTQFPTADPPVTMLRPKATGILDSEGHLCTPDPADPSKPGERMLLMQVPNDPESTVQGWTWKGTPRFVNADGTRLHNTMEPFTFDLPFSDVPFDLVNAVSVPASPGIGKEQAIILAASAQAAATSAAGSAEAAAADAKVAREGVMEAVEAASTAVSDAAVAKTTAETAVAEAERAVTDAGLAVSEASTAKTAAATAVTAATTAATAAERAGTDTAAAKSAATQAATDAAEVKAAGLANDAGVAGLLKAGALSNAALSQSVSAATTQQVPPLVAQAIAADGTVAAAASVAVSASLNQAGVMRGHASIVEDTGSAWRQTSDEGYMLPLGYTPEGRLDAFARTIWREDVNHTTSIENHPTYARVIVTDNNDLLLGITWQGKVVIPGLDLPTQPAPTEPTFTTPSTFYNDVRYTPDTDVMPAHANPAQWAGWGSSSMYFIRSLMADLAQTKGAAFYPGGKGGETSSQIAARLGSIPAKITFSGNTIPGSGAVEVTSSNITHLDLLTFTGYVTDNAGSRIKGSLSSANNALTFTRTTAGAAAPVGSDVQFIPEDGHTHRDAVTFLWMGKNNAWESQRVIDETNASFEFLAPLAKRCIVLGHFNNTGTAADHVLRPHIKTINDAYRRRFGPAFIDVHAYLTGAQVWADTGITPTPEDLAEQSTGNKPPSLSTDSGHLNAAGDKAITDLIDQKVVALGWYK